MTGISCAAYWEDVAECYCHDADTLCIMLITYYHPVKHLSIHRVDLHMQLYAVKVNATMPLLTDGRVAGIRNPPSLQDLARIGCGSSRVVPYQAWRLSAYGGLLWRNSLQWLG